MDSSAMEPEKIVQHLENIAERIGISVRYEDLSVSGFPTKSGLCTIKGKAIYIMDASHTVHRKINLLAECLRSMDLEGIYVVPALRSLLDSSAHSAE
jgi:hypothetical protein